MTLQIKSSEIGDPAAFAARVEAFRQAKLAHHQTVDEPAPVEHHLVESCIRRVPGEDADDYVADYEIIMPTLDEQKAELTANVHKAEAYALHAKLSPAKRRLHSYQLADVVGKNEEQTEEGKAVIATHHELAEHANKIGRHAAQLLSEIEDLDEETIKTWQPAPFPS